VAWQVIFYFCVFILPLPASSCRLVTGILLPAGGWKNFKYPRFLAGSRQHFFAGWCQADFLFSIISIFWLVAGGTCLPAAARLVFYFEYLHLLAGGWRHLLAGYRQAGFFTSNISIFRLVAGDTCLPATARLVLTSNFFAFLCPSAGFRLRLVVGLCQLLSVGHLDLCFFFFVAAAFPETQAGALVAVGMARDARRAADEESSDHFSMEDHLVAMHARITPMTMLGHELWQAAEDLF
jgi:hypothetical protein